MEFLPKKGVNLSIVTAIVDAKMSRKFLCELYYSIRHERVLAA